MRFGLGGNSCIKLFVNLYSTKREQRNAIRTVLNNKVLFFMISMNKNELFKMFCYLKKDKTKQK